MGNISFRNPEITGLTLQKFYYELYLLETCIIQFLDQMECDGNMDIIFQICSFDLYVTIEIQ